MNMEKRFSERKVTAPAANERKKRCTIACGQTTVNELNAFLRGRQFAANKTIQAYLPPF